MEELSEEQAETLRERLIELVVELENGLLANADSASPVVLDQSSVLGRPEIEELSSVEVHF